VQRVQKLGDQQDVSAAKARNVQLCSTRDATSENCQSFFWLRFRTRNIQYSQDERENFVLTVVVLVKKKKNLVLGVGNETS
jgi:hypothetical protein